MFHIVVFTTSVQSAGRNRGHSAATVVNFNWTREGKDVSSSGVGSGELFHQNEILSNDINPNSDLNLTRKYSSFSISAPTVWNNLPAHIRSCTSLSQFYLNSSHTFSSPLSLLINIVPYSPHVQRRATRLMFKDRGFSYGERLRILGLTTLETRRLITRGFNRSF